MAIDSRGSAGQVPGGIHGDHGARFTSWTFTERARRAGLLPSLGTVDRRECLDRLLIVNRRHLERVLAEYVEHFNGHRPHRSLGQQAPDRPAVQVPSPAVGRVRRRDRLGGLIREYQQVA